MRQFALLLLLCLMVLGCQSIVTPEHQPSDQAGLFERIKGKISISGQPSSFSFDWYHTDDSHSLRFSSFGLVVAEVAAKGSDITIQTGDGQTWNQASAQLWMEAHLGIALPFQSVAFWLSGRPDPGHPSITRVNSFSQLGWQVNVNRLHRLGYPQKLTLEKSGIKAKIAVSSWQ